MALPPLRTVRDASPASTPPPVAKGTTFRPSMTAGPANVPAPLRLLINEALRADLIDPVEAEHFFEKIGTKLHELIDRDRAAAALAHHGLLTPFQVERLLAGNTFGMVIGNYRIEDRVGGGTVGIVFRARHKHLKRVVAIKIVPADETTPPQFLERFDLEMELLVRVDHPNVVRVYDTGTLAPSDAGVSPLRYAILEHIDGCDLEDFIYREGLVPVPQVCAWGRQLAAGLAAAHAHNLVHRDFKPSNVLITADRRAKVSDFGLARHFASIATPRPGIVGSVEFMAPEQAMDATTVGPPADVYALGATLMWTLTGQLPYPKTTRSKEALEQIRNSAPRRLRDINPELPAKLDEILARMMAREPGRRPSALEACGWLGTFAAPSVHPAFDHVQPPHSEQELDLLRFAVGHLEDTIAVRDALGQEAGVAVLTAMARVAQFRGESEGQQRRLQEYVRALADVLKSKPEWVMLADPAFVNDMILAIPVRNIGLVGIPDRVLSAPVLNTADQASLERHPLIGCQIVDAVMAKHGKALRFARIARDLIRSHHEKWDGTGFPDRLKQDEIPAAARLVAVAEAYDALRQPQDKEPGLDHDAAITGLVSESVGFFDPSVLDALVSIHEKFAEIFATIPD